MKTFINRMVAVAILGAGAVTLAHAQETLKVGMSNILSGPGASWGVGIVWGAKQAAESINAEGGIKAGGKTYKLEIVAYDNKGNAADGAKVAQTLITRDDVHFVFGTQITAAVSALQATSERAGVLHTTGAWGRRVKGKDFPMTFASVNSLHEIAPPLYGYVKQNTPHAKTVWLVNPNDATGQDVEKLSRGEWEKTGLRVAGSDFYGRETSEFSPLATKIAAAKPDIVDLGSSAPATAGLILRELDTLGWKGVKLAPSADGVEIVKTGGASAEGVYVGLGGDFSGNSATPIQRKLNDLAKKELGRTLDLTFFSGYDSIQALRKGIELTNSVDPQKIAAAWRTMTFESSYGPAAFGYAGEYGAPVHMLLPVIVSQVQSGKSVEVVRVVPEELKRRLSERK